MSKRAGSRPWSIHTFAGLFLVNGLWGLIGGILNIELWLAHYLSTFPSIAWNHDLVIVALSARFTIVCIPVVAIWGYASRIARWLVSVLTIGTALSAAWNISALPNVDIEWLPVAFLSAMVAAVLMLLTPSAAVWFRKEEAPGAEVFS